MCPRIAELIGARLEDLMAELMEHRVRLGQSRAVALLPEAVERHYCGRVFYYRVTAGYVIVAPKDVNPGEIRAVADAFIAKV